MRYAILAPEMPGLSMTFVHGEIEELRNQGVQVRVHALREATQASQDQKAQSLGAETDYLYEDRVKLARDAWRVLWDRPRACLRVLALSLRDFLGGSFSRGRQRVRLPLQVLGALGLAQRLQEQRIDHIHVQFAHSSATVGMYAALLLGIPFSITGHANDLTVEASLLREKLERAQVFRIISESSRAHLRGRVGAALASRAVVIRCGIDLESYALRGRAQASGADTILALGRLVPKKGFDIAIRGFAQVAPQVPGLRLVVAGAGPELERLTLLASQLGISSRVDFLGSVSPSDVPELMAGARAFVLPCREAGNGDVDGIPVVLMEAMARGVPVVSTPVAGIPELVECGRSGLLVDPEDVGGLAKGMLRILKDAAFADRVAKAGRRSVDRLHDLRKTAATLVQVL